MSKKSDNVITQDKVAESMSAVMDKTDRLFDTARPEAVFAEPVTVEGRTIISAAEVMVFAGFGGGGGFGPASAGEDGAPAGASEGAGLGAGVGGAAYSRPVAVIIIDKNGARVEPVVDATKLGLAALTVFGSLLFLLGRMARMARRMG
jgi:uncharacterized spore protein YtfJ